MFEGKFGKISFGKKGTFAFGVDTQTSTCSGMLKIGKHNNVPDWKFNPRELALGIKTELEHTNDRALAKKIAKDHLMEFPDYYTRLLKAGL